MRRAARLALAAAALGLLLGTAAPAWSAERAQEPAAGAAHADEGFDVLMWTARILNFLIFAGVLVYAGWPVLARVLRDRQEEIRHSLEKVREALAEAQRRKTDAETTLARLQEEAAGILAQAEEEAAAERERILEDARRAAERLLHMAEQQIESAGREARADLRRYAADLSTSLAEGILRESIGPEERRRLLEEGLSGLEARA